MAAPPMVMSSSAAPSLTQAYSDSASPLEEVLLSFMAAEINPKNPETHHGRPLQSAFAALVALYRPDQLRGHLWRALENGVTREEIGEVITHLAFYAGWPNAGTAALMAKGVFEERTEEFCYTRAWQFRKEVIP
jgi:4-carboxymuconolactone decarboxylase